MSRRRVIRLPGNYDPLLDIHSLGRVGPSGRLSPAQIQQIQRTVRRVPEVMVKVTGGGKNAGAVAAHFSYIGRKDELAIETDEGDRIVGRDEQKALLKDWHLELSAGQYRAPRDGRTTARKTKLVHNIVLSMPFPTPPQKVMAAARVFGREKFGTQHRYAMVLHTDQKHPHVHMVVKAESEDGRRLHIDKEMLRHWREDFARMMREQGIATNATPRAVRGNTKRPAKASVFGASRRRASTVMVQRVIGVVRELHQTGTVRDPARAKLIETRGKLTESWAATAQALEAQGETLLAAEVRNFAHRLPPALTDKERIAAQYIELQNANESKQTRQDKSARSHERTR